MTKKKRSNFLSHLFKKRNTIQQSTNHEEVESKLLNYYISLVKNHPDIILVFSPDGKIVSHNTDVINKHLGYDIKHISIFKDFIPEKHYVLLQSAFRKTMDGKSARVEFNFFNNKDEQLNIVGTFIPIETSKGNIEGVFLILKDITTEKHLEQSYKLKLNHFEQTNKLAKIGSWEYIIDKNEINYSKTYSDIFGVIDSELMSKNSPLSFVHPDDYDHVNDLLNKTIRDGVGCETKYRIYHRKTNELRHVKVKVEVEKKNNKPFKLIGIVQDITELAMLNEQLVEMNNRYQYTFDHLNVGIWMRESINGKIVFISKGMEQLLQVPLKTLYEEDHVLDKMVVPIDKEQFIEKHKLLNDGEIVEHQYRIKDGKGNIKWIYEQTIPRTNEQGEIIHLFGMIADMTSEVEMKQKLEFLAKHDQLTNLPNHYSLNEKLDNLIKKNNDIPFALLYIDLDNFYWINNYLGREIGDIVLEKLASRLNTLCSNKIYLSKVDNNSFIFILSDFQNKEEVFQFSENIIQKIGQKVKVDGYQFHVTASIGVSFYPDNGDNKLILLENAHTALYHAQYLGKNNYQIYSPDKDIGSHKKYMLEQDLRKAIENEDFELYYQPQVNPKTGVIEGAEALIRWNHEEWGIVSPAEFIPLAEERHLIHQIGDWVIRTVCQQLRTWKNKGYTLYPIAINISPNRFLKPGFVETLKTELNRQQIPAKYIEIEVTENALLQNVKNVSEKISKLKKLGVKIALDDFGTQYSSFHYLQKFDFDKLKIDRSFIQNLCSENKTDTKEAAIVSSFLHLAKELNMKVVAEGVEEYEQFEYLQQKECDTIQGYLYSKPVPVNEFEQMMKVRYLKPKKERNNVKLENERRKYFRFVFPYHLLAKMTLTKVDKQNVNIGFATILIENLSLGGTKFISPLRLPVTSNIKLKFQIDIMNERFKLDGSIVYKSEEKPEIYCYGVSFNISEGDRDKLSRTINKMITLKKRGNDIPSTHFVKEDPYLFLREHVNS